MGYSRMTGKPGVIVIHVTPGIGHSIGNLYNASKSRTPLASSGHAMPTLYRRSPISAACAWAAGSGTPNPTIVAIAR